MVKLPDLYLDPERVVVTAHRGWSGRFPENTMIAFREAASMQVDFIEFDLRGSQERIPIVLHDATLERTANAPGKPGDYTLAELRRLNASYWVGPHDQGRKRAIPALPEAPIPTFEEVLAEVPPAVGLNIQVYETDKPLLEEICRLYHAYDLYERGYLSVSSYRDARRVRELNDDIELCVLEHQGRMGRAALAQQRDFGLRYVQPLRSDVDEAFCRTARELGLRANMFYANTAEHCREYLAYGIRGVLTDFPEIVRKTAQEMGLRT